MPGWPSKCFKNFLYLSDACLHNWKPFSWDPLVLHGKALVGWLRMPRTRSASAGPFAFRDIYYLQICKSILYLHLHDPSKSMAFTCKIQMKAKNHKWMQKRGNNWNQIFALEINIFYAESEKNFQESSKIVG